jgi:phosphopantothenoylcysteine decarboxylase/phosphopantothenate--cysteine ligase
VLTSIDLKDKNILLGVTASISIYKSIELVRLYVKCGANVKVIMTKNAKKFISPMVFETLTRNMVLSGKQESFANENNHIDITKWADVFVIAPVTANSINKFSNGLANDFLSSVVLAYNRTIILAPAANTNMIENHITRASLKLLELNNFIIIPTQEKLLSCNDFGNGALAEIDNIFLHTARELLTDDFWKDTKVIVTSGGTKEKIDDVRYIGNFSSGKFANALAISLFVKGANVCIIGKIRDTIKRSSIHFIPTTSSCELNSALEKSIAFAKIPTTIKASLTEKSKIINKKPFLFMNSAVSDYLPKFPNIGKIKKQDIGSFWSLELKENIDILKKIDKNDIYKIGFKAEFDKNIAKDMAKNSITSKNLDAVCLNILDDDGVNFASNDSKLLFLTKKREVSIKKANKLTISMKLLDIVSNNFIEPNIIKT